MSIYFLVLHAFSFLLKCFVIKELIRTFREGSDYRERYMYLNEEESCLVELYKQADINSCSANPTKWSNTLKQFFDNSRRIV